MTRAGSCGVALGGFMGTGKSTVGRALAARLGLPFIDLDEVLTERFGPISGQFAGEGEAVFRARERALVAELCDGVPRVIATGGGAWVDPTNRAALAAVYRTVVLWASPERLRSRVGEGDGRPLWAEAEALLVRREEAYRDAELGVDTDALDVEGVVEHILGWMERP